MNNNIYLLITILLNSSVASYSQGIKSSSVLSTSNLKGSTAGVVDSGSSSFFGDLFSLFDYSGIKGSDIVILTLLLSIGILAFSSFIHRRRLRSAHMDEQKRAKVMHEKELEIKLMQLNLSLAIEAGDVTVWEYDIAAGSYHNIYDCRLSKENKKTYTDGPDSVHPDDMHKLQTAVEELSTGKISRISVQFRTYNSGTKRYEYLSNDMSAIVSEDGSIKKLMGATRDVTNEVLNKQKFDDAMLHLKLSMQATGLRMWYVENDCVYIFKDGVFAEIDMGTEALANAIHAEDIEKYKRIYDAMLSDGDKTGDTQHKVIFRLFNKLSNDYLHFECSLSAVRDENGKVCRVMGGSYDITKRVREEASINIMRKCLDMFTQASNVLAWREDIATTESKIIYGSIKKACGGQKSLTLSNLHTEDEDLYNNYRSQIVSGETGLAPIFIRVNEGDAYGYYECALSLFTDKEAEQPILVGSLKDMTEVSNLNKSLDNLNRESLVLLESLPVGIAVHDKDGKKEYINSALAKMVGITDIDNYVKNSINLFDDYTFCADDVAGLKKGINVDIITEYDPNMSANLSKMDIKHKGKIYFDAKGRCVRDKNGEIVKYVLILDNITEKHIAELKLADSERNLKLALEAGNVVAWSFDVESEVLYYVGGESSGATLVSLTKDSSLIHPDDKKLRDDLMHDIIEGKTNNGKIVLRYKDEVKGTGYRYFEASMIAKKEDDIVVTIALAFKDITEDHIHAIEREYSRKRISYAIDCAELALMEYDVAQQSVITYKNAIAGFKLEPTLSVDDFLKCVNAEESSEIKLREMLSEMDRGVDKSFLVDFKMKIKTTTGYEWMYCSAGGTPFEKDEEGRIIKYTGFIKNNTTLVLLNNTHAELNTQLRTVFNVGNMTPFTSELKDGKLRVVTSHDEESAFFGILDDEFDFDQLIPFLRPSDQEAMRDALEKLISGEKLDFRMEIRFIIEGLSNNTFELNLSVVQSEEFGVSMRMIGYLQDITERQQLILELKEAKHEAEKAGKLKSAFLANMSHEIRTPLNAIIGFSELLIDEECSDTKTEYINIIAMNNDLLLKLINDILDLSKLEAGFTDLNTSEFDFTQFFNDMHLSMSHRNSNPDVTLSMINPYSRCIVNMDKNGLAQICINYITNAIKYTAKGTIDMGYESINGGIRIYVKDTGIGVADSKKDKVFQRFEKLDDFAQGTGIGLSITKALVESMKGEIGFDSQEGVGSTFWAWVPSNSINISAIGIE